jgi:hypothetical protein
MVLLLCQLPNHIYNIQKNLREVCIVKKGVDVRLINYRNVMVVTSLDFLEVKLILYDASKKTSFYLGHVAKLSKVRV